MVIACNRCERMERIVWRRRFVYPFEKQRTPAAEVLGGIIPLRCIVRGLPTTDLVIGNTDPTAILHELENQHVIWNDKFPMSTPAMFTDIWRKYAIRVVEPLAIVKDHASRSFSLSHLVRNFCAADSLIKSISAPESRSAIKLYFRVSPSTSVTTVQTGQGAIQNTLHSPQESHPLRSKAGPHKLRHLQTRLTSLVHSGREHHSNWRPLNHESWSRPTITLGNPRTCAFNTSPSVQLAWSLSHASRI